MRIAVQVPIKHRSSERVANKNFRQFAGKKLCFWLLDELRAACPPEWDLYVDSESDAVAAIVGERYGARFRFRRRAAWLAGNAANGNHLLWAFANEFPDYDIYAQAFVTAVRLKGATIVRAVETLVDSPRHDSVFLATRETGFWWHNGRPVNYDPAAPDGLPRSQDCRVLKETTGLYAVRNQALLTRGCRVGAAPLPIEIDPDEAADIDTPADLAAAERRQCSETDTEGAAHS